MKIFHSILLSCFLAAVSHAADSPNIVIILADDLGYGDPQCYNAASKIPTPHLDAIAAKGVRFTDAHTPSAVCTPTRYGLLTGRYCWRTRLKSSVLDGFGPPLIEPKRVTIASLLKKKGYATACLGKWHLGMQWTGLDGATIGDRDPEVRGFRPGDAIDFTKAITGGPNAVGFDRYFGISASLDMPPYLWIENDRVVAQPDAVMPSAREAFLSTTTGKMTSDFTLEGVLPRLKSEAVKWIGEKKDTPFFLYLPLNAPHLPVVPNSEFTGKSQAGHYGDFVFEVDDFVGAVTAALVKNAIAENTLVLFTADNGSLFHWWKAKNPADIAGYRITERGNVVKGFGHRGNAELRGTKADIWEGGHRVPFLMQWPATIPAASVSDEPVELTDLLATVAAIVGEDLPEDAGEDSYNILPAMLGEARKGPIREALVHHSLRGLFAIRQGDWKLVIGQGSGGFSQPRGMKRDPEQPDGQLYDLKNDPQETKNLYDQHPDRVAAMTALLEKYQNTGRSRARESVGR
jgi:arylsulfatase A-like enzyme